jgi:rubrerythrin
MTIGFSPAELYDIAIAVERRGAAFYDTLARTCSSEETREAFVALAAMEHAHIQTFQRLAAEAPDTLGEGAEAEEYADYFKALVESAVFNDDLATSDLVTKVDTDRQAVEVGIEAEKDAILFYEQLRDIVSGDAGEAIAGIIAEEKAHLRQLAAIKTQL